MLSIGVPLLAVYVILLWADYRHLKEAVYARTRVHLTEVVKEHAARLEGDLRTVAQACRSTAAILNRQPDLNDTQINELLKINAEMHPMIHGSRLAFTERGADPAEMRVVESTDPDTVQVIPHDKLDYTRLPWYTTVAQTQLARWAETMSADDEQAPQYCVYAEPIYRGDKLRGVVAVEVSLEHLRETLRKTEFEGAHMSLVSASGRYISHRSDEFVLRRSVFGTGEIEARQNVKELEAAMGTLQTGMRVIDGFPEKGVHLIFFAPIVSTGWSYMATARQEVVMEPVYDELRRRPFIHLTGFLCILGVIFVAAMRITHPVLTLADGVAKLSTGNLDATIDTIDSKDELGDLSYAFNKMVVDLKDHVSRLKIETATRERVQSELRVGRDIQASLLPRTFPDHAEFELNAVNIPAKEIAGDFYDFFFTEDDLLTIVCADVSGKGVPAAMFMAVSRTVVRNLALTGLSPAAIMQQANETLIKDNDKGLFLTIWIGQYNVRTGELTYANCGHPPPYLLTAEHKVETFGEVTGPLLGVIEEEDFGIVEERTLTLWPGETIMLYTDGIPEAISPEGDFLGDARFKRLLSDLAGETVQRLCTLAIERVDAFVANVANDDRTLLALQRKI